MENVVGVLLVVVVFVGMLLPKFPGLMPVEVFEVDPPQFMEVY